MTIISLTSNIHLTIIINHHLHQISNINVHMHPTIYLKEIKFILHAQMDTKRLQNQLFHQAEKNSLHAKDGRPRRKLPERSNREPAATAASTAAAETR